MNSFLSQHIFFFSQYIFEFFLLEQYQRGDSLVPNYKNWHSSWKATSWLTRPRKWSGMFSAETGKMSFFSSVLWMRRDWLTPVIAIIRARRVTTSAVSMFLNQGRGQISASQQDSLAMQVHFLGWDERLVLCPPYSTFRLNSVIVTASP